MGFDDITRAEFLHTIARSRMVRALPWLAAVILFVLVAPSLWQMRYIVAVLAAIFAGGIAINAANYWFASDQRRRKIDEKIRLDKLHWSYGLRWLMWTGLAMAVGQVVAYWASGHDQSLPLSVSAVFFVVGGIAHIVWAVWRSKHPLKSCAGDSENAADR